MEMLKRDLQDLQTNKDLNEMPIKYGAFPVPKYSLIGKESFKEISCGSNYKRIPYSENKNLIYTFLCINRNEVSMLHAPADNPYEIFFTIMVLSDIPVDTIDNSHAKVHMTSRNHPDYIGEGFIRTQQDRIEYIAFTTAERNEYAVVNMRLFNLNHGRTILIAPQKDGSLRSLQIKSDSILSIENIDSYLDELLEQHNIKTFLSDKNNI